MSHGDGNQLTRVGREFNIECSAGAFGNRNGAFICFDLVDRCNLVIVNFFGRDLDRLQPVPGQTDDCLTIKGVAVFSSSQNNGLP